MINENRTEKILKNFENKRILVVGDIILDRYLHGEVKRISPEAPVPVLNVCKEEYKAGGAANVDNNIHRFCANTVLLGITGKDYYGDQLSNIVKDASHLLFRNYADTIVKSRVVARKQQILRIDREKRNNPDDSDEKQIIKKIEESKVDGIVLSDYAKGFLTSKISHSLTQKSKTDNIPYLIDPKPKNLSLYGESSCMCPNTVEAEQLSNMFIKNNDDAVKSAKIIKKKYNCTSILITRGEDGITSLDNEDNIFHVPSISHEVYDVTGAGDSVAAILLLSLISGASFKEAVELANIGASITIEKLGTATVSAKEILSRLKFLKEFEGHQ